MEADERIHLVVKGRVQGVFFRASTKEKALALGIKGWVKNLPDDTVEIVAEGQKEFISDFIEWCKAGPKHAVVSEIEIEHLPSTGEFKDFNIEY